MLNKKLALIVGLFLASASAEECYVKLATLGEIKAESSYYKDSALWGPTIDVPNCSYADNCSGSTVDDGSELKTKLFSDHEMRGIKTGGLGTTDFQAIVGKRDESKPDGALKTHMLASYYGTMHCQSFNSAETTALLAGYSNVNVNDYFDDLCDTNKSYYFPKGKYVEQIKVGYMYDFAKSRYAPGSIYYNSDDWTTGTSWATVFSLHFFFSDDTSFFIGNPDGQYGIKINYFETFDFAEDEPPVGFLTKRSAPASWSNDATHLIEFYEYNPRVTECTADKVAAAVGLIVGIVVAVIFVIVCCCCSVYCYRRCKKNKKPEDSMKVTVTAVELKHDEEKPKKKKKSKTRKKAKKDNDTHSSFESDSSGSDSK